MAVLKYSRSFNNILSKISPVSSTCFYQKREYAMKNPVPIKWIRPEKVPCFKPEKSGDLKPLKEINKYEYPLEFRDCEELKTANDVVKRLFSLEFSPYKKTVEVLRDEYSKLVKRHKLDERSPEARAAKMTADIRDMQRYIEERPHDKRALVRLKETIDKRRRLLKLLRTKDYKLYEWLLEKLDLEYKPIPDPDIYKRVERKRSLRMLTKEHCEDIVNTKLSMLRTELEAKQEKFLEDKIKTLQWIIKEEAECGVKPTVTEDDIKQAQQKLSELKDFRLKNTKAELES